MLVCISNHVARGGLGTPIRDSTEQSKLKGQNVERAIMVGWVLSALAAAFLFLAGVMNILKAPPAIKSMEAVGYPLDLLRTFGFFKVLIAILSLFPVTSLIGAILATGWMGGAIAAHVRVKDKFFIQAVIPIIIWIGFGLRHQSAMHSLLGF
jgi:hypothetical protein